MGTNLQKSRSCSSLDGSKSNSTKSFNNYLTVHVSISVYILNRWCLIRLEPMCFVRSQSFPGNNKIPTITTTQSMDDLMTENGSNIGVNMEPLARRKSSTTTIQVSPNSPTPETNEKHGWTTMTPQEISYWIDRRSRVLFPSAFIAFNIFYWTFVYFF